jgi:MFS family permease
MIDLDKHPSLKYILFCVLYISEGLVVALTSVVIVLYFTEKDISISTTTLVGGISSVPWAIKFVFGPTIDFFGKYGRKFFIILGGTIGTLSILILAFIDPKTAIIPFTIFLFLGHSGVVLLDVTVDAWAIQITKVNERGKANAAMFTGLFTGLGLGGILLAYVATYYSFEMVFITTAFLIFLTFVLTFFVKEMKLEIMRKQIVPLLIKEFRKKNTQIVSLLGFVNGMNFGMLRFVIPEYMTKVLFLDKMQIGILTSVYPISIVAGVIMGGITTDKWGRKKVLYISTVGLLISIAFLITADTWEKLAFIYTFIGIFTGASGYSAMSALAMDVSNPKIGGAQYSFIASIANFGGVLMGAVSGAMVVFLGYNRFFLYTALTVAVSLLIVYFVKETHKK